MTRGYMLDTDIASYLIKGRHPSLDQRVARLPVSQFCISAITQGELRFGCARLPQAIRLAGEVERFLRGITVLAWDAAAADRYGLLRAELESMGQPIGSLDTLIAAHALASDVTLVTHNKREFERVPELRIESDWAAGS